MWFSPVSALRLGVTMTSARTRLAAGLLLGGRGPPGRSPALGPYRSQGLNLLPGNSQFLGRWTCPSTPCAVSVPARMAARSWSTKARS